MIQSGTPGRHLVSIHQMAPLKRGSTHSVWSFAVLLSVCLSLCLFACLSMFLSACISVCLSAYVSVCMSVYLSVCLCVYRSSDQQRDACDGVERTARWQEAQRSDSQVTDSLVTLLQLIQS